jgi:hypothetical protein
MTMKASEARRLALAFPDAHEAPHFEYDSFRVKGRIFATLLPDGTRLNVFVDEAMREQALILHAECVTPLHWGAKVVGLSLNVANASNDVAFKLLENAWKRKAGKRLCAAYEKRAGRPLARE